MRQGHAYPETQLTDHIKIIKSDIDAFKEDGQDPSIEPENDDTSVQQLLFIFLLRRT